MPFYPPFSVNLFLPSVNLFLPYFLFYLPFAVSECPVCPNCFLSRFAVIRLGFIAERLFRFFLLPFILLRLSLLFRFLAIGLFPHCLMIFLFSFCLIGVITELVRFPSFSLPFFIIFCYFRLLFSILSPSELPTRANCQNSLFLSLYHVSKPDSFFISTFYLFFKLCCYAYDTSHFALRI